MIRIELKDTGKHENIKGFDIGYANGSDGQFYVFTLDNQKLKFCYGRKNKKDAKLAAMSAIDTYLKIKN
jgi:hypothetical protein